MALEYNNRLNQYWIDIGREVMIQFVYRDYHIVMYEA